MFMTHTQKGTKMTEKEKLAEQDRELGVTHRHVSWGPEGHKMSDEEKAAYLLKVEAQVRSDLANTVEIPVSQLVAIADSLRALSDLSKADVHEWMKMPKEIADLRHQIGALVDMSHVFAEQWLPEDLQKQRREERLAKR